MMVPSGNGSFFVFSIGLHRLIVAQNEMARRSLRLPSSWATEINAQSRYPVGILVAGDRERPLHPRVDADVVKAGTCWPALQLQRTGKLIRFLMSVPH